MGQLRKRGGVWWVRYYRNGQRHEESSGSDKKGVAVDLLKLREGDVAKGLPVSARIGRLRFEEAAQDVIHDYQMNGKRSLRVVERRIHKHLLPYFGGRKLASITTAEIRSYVAHRLAQTTITKAAYTVKGKDGTERQVAAQERPIDRVSNGEINRELTILRRIFNLAIQAGKLLHKPHVPLLHEDNVRLGFFEPEQYAAVLRHLPAEIQPVITFAYVTGWRIASEVLPLEWRQVDLRAGEIRLDAGTTKNREGRVFPVTDDLRVLLECQLEERQKAQKAGHVVPWVFFRMVGKRGGKAEKTPRPILAFTKAWKVACVQAGCPGRIPHDLRRTAVRNMVRRGVPERVAMKLTGHKTASIFARYDIVSDGDLRTAADRLSGLAGTIQGQSRPIASIATAKPR